MSEELIDPVVIQELPEHKTEGLGSDRVETFL